MKKLVLRNPESLIHRYNLSVLLHNSAQTILEQKDRKKEQTERSIEFLKKIQPIYEYLFKNHYARKTREDLEKCDDSRKKTRRLMDRMREASENKLNYIQSHQDRFETFLREDEEMIKKKLLSVEEKKKKIQEMKERELHEKLEKEKKEEIQRKEYERLASEQMENAQKIAEGLREKQENQQQKRSKIQGRKLKNTSRKRKKNEENEEKSGSEDERLMEDFNESEENDEIEKKDPFIFDDKDDEKEEEVEKEDSLDQLERLAEEKRKDKKKNLKRKFKENEEFTEINNEENLNILAKKKRKIVLKHFDDDEGNENDGIFHEMEESPMDKASPKSEASSKSKSSNEVAYDPLKSGAGEKKNEAEEEEYL